jgi:hypothetical protein
MTLRFEKAGTVQVEVSVDAPGGAAAPMASHAGH